MKKIAKYLIIPLFSIFAFFLLFNTNVSAALVGGEIPGDNSGDITVNPPPIQGEELYEQCHTYITTNIISAESLTEALNGKIYGNFTQEDCMEMINIASKREVIKNVYNLENITNKEACGLTLSIIDGDIININGTITRANCGFGFVFLDTKNYYGHTISLQTLYKEDATSVRFMLHNQKWDFQYNVTGTGLKYINTDEPLSLNFQTFTDSIGIVINNWQFKIQIEKGSTATRYVSYDYHREYYEEGIDYADNRVNTNSTSYAQGVTDADNRVNTNSVNYKSGVNSGYEKATKDGKSLGTFIPNLLGGFGSFFLTILNIDILGFNLLSIFGIAITIGIIILILKFMRG